MYKLNHFLIYKATYDYDYGINILSIYSQKKTLFFKMMKKVYKTKKV